MRLKAKEARIIIYVEHNDWQLVDGPDQVGSRRWSIDYEAVFRFTQTGKLYRFNWSAGATEMQEERPFEYEDEVEPVEVDAVEVTVTKYVPV